MNNDSNPASSENSSATYEEQLAAWKADPKYAAYFKLLALPRVVLAPSANANRALATAPAGEGEVIVDRYAYAKSVADALKIDVLGKISCGEAKVFSMEYRRAETIRDVAHLKYEHLLDIAGPVVEDRVASSGEPGPGVFTVNEVRRAIALLAGRRKLTNEAELGAGCWPGMTEEGRPHESVVLVNASEAASFNGDRVLHKVDHPRCRGQLLNFDTIPKPWYEYEKLAKLIQEASDPNWRIAVMNDCINMFGKWKWSDKASSPIVITGLIMSTWVQTMWTWRPQVLVLGKTKSGKSTLCKALSGLFGSLCKTCSDSTAAGIRQIIKTSASVILYDEFDVENRSQAEEQQKILKMLRAAGRGDSMFRGTSNQKGEEFRLQHIIWLAGIQISSPREADRNRYITLELEQAELSERGKLNIPDADTLHDMGQRLLAVAIYCIKEARQLADRLKSVQIEHVDARVVESYAAPAAMLAVVQGADEAGAKELLIEMLAGKANVDEIQNDESALLTDILGAKVQIGGDRFSVAQLMELAQSSKAGFDNAIRTLESNGIKFGVFESDSGRGLAGKGCVLFAHQLISAHLLRGTRWESQAIDQILARAQTASRTRRRIGGQRVRCIAISKEYMESEFTGRDEVSEIEF